MPVVFHEQIIEIISVVTGCSLAKGDEVRRALGDFEGQQQARNWFLPRAILVATQNRWPNASGRCWPRSRPSGSARPTLPHSRCPPTSPPG